MKKIKTFINTTLMTSAVSAIITSSAIAGMGMGAPNFRSGLGSQHYQFSVDISEDAFVNPGRFAQVTGGMEFIDEDGDGICDVAQDSDLFQEAMGAGTFIDENEDGIHDGFQTRAFYQTAGMHNFVDLDGDGICDNYQLQISYPQPQDIGEE